MCKENDLFLDEVTITERCRYGVYAHRGKMSMAQTAANRRGKLRSR